MVATLDMADLPVDQQKVVGTLLTAALQSPLVNRPDGADQFCDQVDIHHGDRTVRHHRQEPDVPEAVRPLLAELTRRAKPAH
ncbi:MAG: protealysin inhibitor emfourin [Dermatophilaceae bacterium]